jgi:geranylgeranyl diphosphate synthase type I
VEEVEAMIAENLGRATAVLEEAPLSRDARAELGSLAKAVTRRTS